MITRHEAAWSPATMPVPDVAHRRSLLAIYFGGAAALVPWIVLLALFQAPRALAHHFPWVAVGTILLVALSCLVAGVLCWNGRPSALASATFAGSLAFVALWFRLVAGNAGGQHVVAVRSFVVLAVPLVVSIVVVARMVAAGQLPRPTRQLLAVAFWAAAALAAFGAARFAAFVPATALEHRLRLLWTGLDCFEMLGMLATGLALLRRSPYLPLPATFTAAMLLADAWNNITSTEAQAQLAAIVMGLVEVPLAIVSMVVAAYGTRLWVAAQARPDPQRDLAWPPQR